MSYKFQIDLSGIIELLSKHLYSSPQVYLRELLQNGVDAVYARQAFDKAHRGQISVKTFRAEDGVPCLVFRDNGVGLTEEEIHKFLATIGKSSKKEVSELQSNDFIGQFGIGLLSCFVVSETIEMKTCSARGAGETIEWKGVDDGTYSLQKIDEKIDFGTEVLLKCKSGFETYFESEFVKITLKNFGGLLPFPIEFNGIEKLNSDVPPWEKDFLTLTEEQNAYLEYGKRIYKMDFLDYVKLDSTNGDFDGAAYILPFSPNLASKKTHRVYLKNMLLSETAEGLLPDWAFFVKGIINVKKLCPTASRESFYEDENLLTARNELGGKLRDYLLELAKSNPTKLRKLISIHYISIKALAVEDDDFYQMFIDWMPFETTNGYMSLGEYKKQNERILFIQNRDQFRQISQVALAQGLSVINASFVYDAELLEKHYQIFRHTPIEEVTPASFTQTFTNLTLDEQEETANFLRAADEVLKSFKCLADIRKFSPNELPAIYLVDEEANFRRSIEQTKNIVDDLWASVLDGIDLPNAGGDFAQLCFNFSNPLIKKIAFKQDLYLIKLSVKILYVQSLMMSHRPLNNEEMKMMNESMLELLEHSLDFDFAEEILV